MGGRFRTYKIPDGKPPNVFALGEKFMPRAYALSVIHETHDAWARCALLGGGRGGRARGARVGRLGRQPGRALLS